jgi:hypothetical protein
MAEPNRLTVRVVNVDEKEIAGAQVAVTVRKGQTVLDQFPLGPASREIPLKSGFVQVEFRITAPQYFPEEGELLFNVYNRWDSTNGCWKLTEDAGLVKLDITLGRLRYAKVVSLPPAHEVPPSYVAPGIVLDERPQYRAYWPDAERKMRILRRPAKGNLDLDEWDRFANDPFTIKLGDCGNWLFLEYGDPEKEGENTRFLLGVWAPHSIPLGTRPTVVIQLTPNPVGYPVDRFPFTGEYPFRLVPEQVPKPPATTVPISKMHQRYADLAIDRGLLSWRVVYQIYGARPDLFSGPNGPIVITVVPAATDQGVQRGPMSHREGIGRMTAEVLRFVWSRRLTLASGSGRLKLLFPISGPGSVTEIAAGRPATSPSGYPNEVASTILTHSAGVGALAQLAGSIGEFPKQFPRDRWGGCLSFGDKDWKGIWLIDGVGLDSDGRVLWQPTKGSTIANVWKTWARSDKDRRFVAVYTEAGLSGADQNGIVDAKRVGGKKGWIEEGQSPDKQLSWLRISNSLLAPTNPSNPAFADAAPRIGERGKPHDDIFLIGIGYAARRAP